MTLTYLPGGAINYTYVDDPELNELITEARVTVDKDEQIGRSCSRPRRWCGTTCTTTSCTRRTCSSRTASEWSGFKVKPSELLSIVNPVSVASGDQGRQ